MTKQEFMKKFTEEFVVPQEGFNLFHFLDEIEWALIDKALDRHKYIRARAARMLGIKRTTLVEKMQRREQF